MANASTDFTVLDFDQLRDSLIEFLRSQDEYKDYDLESSNMRTLIDLLSVNAHRHAFFLHMNLSESFLDSAQLYTSMISHAKELNYLPRSVRSSQAQISFTFTGDRPTYLLRKGQGFSTIVKSNTYIFSLADSVLMTSSNGFFSANLTIYEGSYVSDTYVMDRNSEVQRFLIANKDVDVSSLAVAVYEDGSLSGETYRLANTLLGLNETSKRYFVQQAENEMYEINFGDGVVGYRPKDGSRVVLDYRITHGSDANGARLFVPNFNPGPSEDAGQINVQTISAASHGAGRESIESIRYMAPRHFRIQERAVSDSDFSISLREQYPEIQAVSTYGGETLTPPRFGKVVVAVALEGIDGIPESKKDEYEKFLKDRMSLTMGVIFAEPIRSYVSVRSRVRYNLNQSTLTEENMKSIVATTVVDWAAEELDDFGSRIRYSKFCRVIDEADRSIVGNETDLLLYKKIRPSLGSFQNLDIDFAAPLALTTQDEDLDQPDASLKSLYSSNFYVNGLLARFEDDGGGRVLNVVTFDGKERYTQQIGTVNYETGVVKLSSLYLDSYAGNHLKVYSRLRNKDVTANKATIMAIEPDEIVLSVEAVRE